MRTPIHVLLSLCIVAQHPSFDVPAQLAILPRTTHFTSITSPILVPIVDAFLRG